MANIEGIQSEDVMADAKHYSAYNQETARYLVNQVISGRALAEIYQVPFEAAVQQGHVATIMCSYGSLNGVNSCSSPVPLPGPPVLGVHQGSCALTSTPSKPR